jgi:OmpA-OmpF porin, OOP family
MKGKILLFIAAISSATVFGQNKDRDLGLGIHGGIIGYNGEFGNPLFDTKGNHGAVGISLDYYLSPTFDAGVLFSHGLIDGYDNDFDSTDIRLVGADSYFSTKIYDLSVMAKLKMANGKILSEDSKISPYLAFGFGTSASELSAKLRNETVSSLDFNFPLGAGIKYNVNEWFSLQIASIYRYSLSDLLDDVQPTNSTLDKTGRKKFQDQFITHTAGLVFNLHSFKDTDKDGIADNKDECPDVAGLPEFKGCPDTDKDGITDKLDACPTASGLIALMGCPDGDGDGIADKDDECPAAAGASELKGCPDGDKDGIADKNDECPTAAGSVAMKGCPDTDGDGLADKNDGCPTVAGSIAMKGCPDGDGDGISDKDDKCPTVKGLSKNKGCPEIEEKDQKAIVSIAKQIFFETGKDVLKPVSVKQLDELVTILTKYDNVNMSVEGHTDDSGDDAKNMKLSEDRANAVKNYLIGKGIAAPRLTAKGFGETMPIGDNKTANGKAQNRRVELNTTF